MIAPGAVTRGRDVERARIVAALIDVIADHGYEQTTLDMVLRRAGVEEQVFHRYFADVEDCFFQTLKEMDAEFLQKVGAALASEKEWRDQVRATAYAMLEFLVEDSKRARFIFLGTLAAGGRAQLLRDQTMSFFTDLLDQGRNELENPESVSRATAEGVAGAIYYRIHTSIAHGSLDDLDALRELFRQFMYTAVLPYLGTEAALEELQMPWPDPTKALDANGMPERKNAQERGRG